MACGVKFKTAIDEVLPVADDASNDNMSDVIGNKTDTIDGDSIVSLVKSVNSDAIQSSVPNRVVTAMLYVSPNGDDSDGSTWEKAYTTIQGALDAASTDVNECTLILVGINTGANFYNIDTAGDPTYSGNYIIKGTHRTWQKIKNTNVGATSILKFTGYISLQDLNFNLGAGGGNGVIITKGAFRVCTCQFVGEDLTGPATSLHIDCATTCKHGKIIDSEFRGHVTHMTGILLDNTEKNVVSHVNIHDCLTAIQIVDSDSDGNRFDNVDIGGCAIAFDIDAGNEQHIKDTLFHDNTVNIDDEVGDHIYQNIDGAFPMDTLPDDLTGVAVAADAVADTWGADVEILSAVSRTKPFRIIGYHFEPAVTQKHKVRFTADNGGSYFDEEFVEGKKNTSQGSPSGTEFIFNAGTQIKASCKAETGGGDVVDVWIKVQQI